MKIIDKINYEKLAESDNGSIIYGHKSFVLNFGLYMEKWASYSIIWHVTGDENSGQITLVKCPLWIRIPVLMDRNRFLKKW